MGVHGATEAARIIASSAAFQIGDRSPAGPHRRVRLDAEQVVAIVAVHTPVHHLGRTATDADR